jgi:glucose/arabinose dehydrogenase
MIMSLNHDEGVALTGQDVPQIGNLYRLNGQNGTATAMSDFGDQSYAWTQDHKDLWEEFPDANPYGVLVTRDGSGRTRTFVADAGANTISEVLPGGTARVIAYIPNEGGESGTTGTRDSTPTCIAQGPDGMLYVGTLDLLTNFDDGPGHSQVWKVDPNSTDWQHNATIWARGLTTITGCTFDQAGNFWAAEMFQPNVAGPPGDLAVVSFSDPTSIEHVGGGSLLLPGGVAQGPDGAMYATTGSAAANGDGGVVRVATD